MNHPTDSKFRNQNSNSSSPSPNSHSRSRSNSLSPRREPDQKKESNDKSHNKYHNTHNKINVDDEGKLYLANIPLNFSQQKIRQEFEKYGKVLELKLRKKTEVQNPYYFGYIKFCRKADSELALNNITKIYNWTVAPFNTKDKNANKERNLNNLNNNISNLNNLNNLNFNPNASLLQNEEKNNNINGGIKVREILVGNLPLSTSQTDLYKEFFIFGEISKIDLKPLDNQNQSYAYIKFRLINSALKALEQNDKMNYKGNILNITLSNVNQRRDIKGNESRYELNETNCKLIVVCLTKNKNLENNINETFVLNIFEKYGDIKYVLIKNINNRIHIFAEYYKPEHAALAIDQLNKNIEMKKLFGDENCEIDFYFRNKWNEINPCFNELNNNMPNSENNSNNFQNCNNNVNNVNNIMNNKNMMMPKMGMTPTLLLQFMQQQQNLLNKQLNNNINNKPQLNDINQINNLNLSNNLINANNIQPNPIQPNINMPYPYNPRFPYFPGFNLPQNSRNFPPTQNPSIKNLQILQALCNKAKMNLNNPNANMNAMNNLMPNYMNANININNNLNLKNNININNNINNNMNKNNNNKANEVNVKDILSQLMTDKNNQKHNNSNNNSDSDNCSVNGSHQSTEEMEYEKDYSLEGENLQIIWNGYLTKNGKDRINVDMYKIRGNIDDTYFKEITLNVVNRIQYEEVMKKRELGLVAISPQSITQKENFDSFSNYLQEKQRCGVINLSDNKYTLYIVSPCEFSKQFYVNPKKHLLGILVDANIDPSRTDTPIPPPVISLTEKRRLLSKNRKNDNAKKEKDSEQDKFKKLQQELKNNLDEDKIKNVEELIKQNPDFKSIIAKLSNS